MNGETIGLVIQAFVAIFTGLAALFSLFAVRKASKSNEIALEQYKENIELQKQSNRPVLDLATKHYTVDLTQSYFSDWSDADEDLLLPKHASQSFLEIANIGNRTARNVRSSFYYEGLEHVDKLIDGGVRDLFQTKSVKFEISRDSYEEIEFSRYWMHEENHNTKKLHTYDDLPYVDYYGSVQPFSGNQDSNVKIYIPKLYVYLNNLFADKMIVDNDFRIYLCFKIWYTDPFQKKYIQKFRIENRIKKQRIGTDNQLFGQIIPEEFQNIEVQEKDE